MTQPTDPPAFQPFDADGGLILAVRLPGAPGALAAARASGWSGLEQPSEPPPLWVHLDRTKPQAKAWVREAAGLDALVAESLLAEDTRPRAQSVGDGMLVILRGVNLNPGADPDELIAIRMWLAPTRVVSLRQYRFQTTAELRAAAERGVAPTTAGAFLVAVAGGLASRLGPSVANLEELLDEIEDAMVASDRDGPDVRGRLATIRRQAIAYRRYLVPQRDTLMGLAASAHPLLAERDRAELRFVAEQVARIVDALEELRDRAAVTHEELRARHDARVGRTVYLLTVVATIALPLGLLTGLLGINVGGIPLAESSYGFAIICGVLVAIAIVEVVLFRSLRWL